MALFWIVICIMLAWKTALNRNMTVEIKKIYRIINRVKSKIAKIETAKIKECLSVISFLEEFEDSKKTFWSKLTFKAHFYFLQDQSLMGLQQTFFSVRDQWTSSYVVRYFGNFIFGFPSLRLRDFLYDVFPLQGKMGKTKWKISNSTNTDLIRQAKIQSYPWNKRKINKL